jgi:hypothetical protein
MMDLIRDIILIEDGGTQKIRGEKRGYNIYYCLESPVFSNMDLFGCEVEVKEENEELIFVRVHKVSPYVTHIYAWSRGFLESEKGLNLKKKISEVGGEWEQVMGGVFFIHLPKEKDHLLTEILSIAE